LVVTWLCGKVEVPIGFVESDAVAEQLQG
jgi:hypothetical protein